MISTYGQEKPPIRNLMHAVGRQLTMHGFIAGKQWGDQYGKAAAAIKELLAAGKIRWKEHHFAWDKFPDALEGLLTGTKFGKVTFPSWLCFEINFFRVEARFIPRFLLLLRNLISNRRDFFEIIQSKKPDLSGFPMRGREF